MNTSAPVRPEERRRRVEGPAWADTVPACFRSEAFAEDLCELPTAAPLPWPFGRTAAAGREQAPAVAAQAAR